MVLSNIIDKLNKIDKTREYRTNVIYITTKCNFKCEYCVTPDSNILMSDLTVKPIETIEVGDEIIGFDENIINNQRQYRKSIVTRVMSRYINDNIHAVNNELNITGEHPILSNNNEFLSISDILIKNENERIGWKINIKNIIEHDYVSIKNKINLNINTYYYSGYVYNLETTTGTYIVNGYLVHNCFENDKKQQPGFISSTCSDEEIMTFIDDIYRREFDLNGRCITVMGGEPFIVYDKLKFMFDYCTKTLNKDKATAIGIFTNGSFFCNEKNVAMFKEAVDHYRKYNLRIQINISYDGTGQALRHKKENYINKAIDKVFEYKIPFDISYTVNNLNYKYVHRDLLEFKRKYNCNIQLNIARSHLENTIPNFDYDKYFEYLQQHVSSLCTLPMHTKPKHYSFIRNYQLPSQELIEFDTRDNFLFDMIYRGKDDN